MIPIITMPIENKIKVVKDFDSVSGWKPIAESPVIWQGPGNLPASVCIFHRDSGYAGVESPYCVNYCRYHFNKEGYGDPWFMVTIDHGLYDLTLLEAVEKYTQRTNDLIWDYLNRVGDFNSGKTLDDMAVHYDTFNNQIRKAK